MEDKTKIYKCESCGHVMDEDDIVTASDPWTSDGTVDVCPECNTAEMLTKIDEIDWKFERREEARLDAMFEARYAEED